MIAARRTTASPGPRPARLRTAMVLAAALLCFCAAPEGARSSATETLMIRGQLQTLRTYGVRGADPVIVSSGDGGWIHLGPHVAETLAAHGSFVIGFDVKSYLEGFTSSHGALRPEDVAGDYQLLIAAAARGASKKPVLIGVSEGAGLSILAAGDPRIHAAAAGVLGIGVPPTSELGWRWRDAIIYVTHGVPNEPTFSTDPIIGKVAPLPLASIFSTHDEFITADEARQLVAHAADPKKLWLVSAADHRFSDNLVEFDARLLEALGWVRERAAR
jgi:Bacterial virulence protein (VirJ)